MICKQIVNNFNNFKRARTFLFAVKWLQVSKVKLSPFVEGDQKASFSIATTPSCSGGRYFFTWIASIYPWYVPYIDEC